MDLIGILGIVIAFFFGLACGEINGESRAIKIFNKQPTKIKFGDHDFEGRLQK